MKSQEMKPEQHSLGTRDVFTSRLPSTGGGPKPTEPRAAMSEMFEASRVPEATGFLRRSRTRSLTACGSPVSQLWPREE